MAAWHEAERWTGLVDGSACPFCAREPRGVLAETETSWVTSAGEVPCRGYVCVIVRRHVVEPFELRPDEAAAFFGEVWRVADAIRDLFRPVKLNYEIHGNTIPHLHVHVFPRYMGDAFEGGPICAGERHAMHSDADLGAIRSRVGAALA